MDPLLESSELMCCNQIQFGSTVWTGGGRHFHRFDSVIDLTRMHKGNLHQARNEHNHILSMSTELTRYKTQEDVNHSSAYQVTAI